MNHQPIVNLPFDRLTAILDVIQEGVWEWNCNTGEVKRSPGWYHMLGYEVNSQAATVLTWENIIHPDDYPLVMRLFEDYLAGVASTYAIEYRCKKHNGDYLWIYDQGKIITRNNDGTPALMIGAHQDIHTRKITQEILQEQNSLLAQSNLTLESLMENLISNRTKELIEINHQLTKNIQEIERLKNLDHLTALYNRHKMEIELEKEAARANRYNTPLSVALFDIDNFKPINDKYGHDIGDEVLKRVGQRVRNHLRSSDIVGRWGGDEFFIILPGIDLQQAQTGINKLRELLHSQPIIDHVSLSCSFGVTQYKNDDDLLSIYKRTDKALYQSKYAGRNLVTPI